MKIAIMGASGQVGQKTVTQLLAFEHELVLFSRSSNACSEAISQGATVIASILFVYLCFYLSVG